MLSAQQEQALAYMKQGYNCFITGDPGTGKSCTINRYVEYCENNNISVMICAPTGIAALNVNGVTAHRLFKIPRHPILEPAKSLPKTLKDVDTIIIDEISMLRIDCFEYICEQLIALNIFRRKNYMKDIQIILCGDFFQLPPVITDRDRHVLEDYRYGPGLNNGFAFQSKYWNQLGLINIVLTQVFRQSDTLFIQGLNRIRYGYTDSINYFNHYSNPKEIKNAILLCGTNRKANDKNKLEFNKLNTPIFTYIAEIKGDVLESDKVVPEELSLRVGCRVMTMINNGELYKNGSFATVKQLKQDEIIIELDNGNIAKIERYTWEINEYSTDKKNKLKLNSVGKYTQFPLKLAYAITIHKSQGQTYDDVNLDPYAWDCGQLYVALSRCKSIEHTHLTQPIYPSYVKTAPEVIDFYSKL